MHYLRELKINISMPYLVLFQGKWIDPEDACLALDAIMLKIFAAKKRLRSKTEYYVTSH
jgi:hypothetical protein|tara:strand:+ start:20 stop:196 length:177 start_codon:yes stop_codon:yes gene_type:complete